MLGWVWIKGYNTKCGYAAETSPKTSSCASSVFGFRGFNNHKIVSHFCKVMTIQQHCFVSCSHWSLVNNGKLTEATTLLALMSEASHGMRFEWLDIIDAYLYSQNNIFINVNRIWNFSHWFIILRKIIWHADLISDSEIYTSKIQLAK